MGILGTIIDEVVAAFRRNSRRGPASEHWYPPAETRDAVGLHRHVCFYCLRYDPKERLHTKPPCTGRRPEQEA
jgi:hypothetical protein